MKKRARFLILWAFFICMMFGVGKMSVRAEGVSQDILVNSTYGGQMSSSGDVRYYNFNLSKAGKISVTFSHENLNDTSNYWEIEIYNLNKEKVARMVSAGTETKKTSAEVGLASGQYYVQVECYNYSSANYNIRVNYTASNNWETETNDGYGTADSITVNTDYSGANQFSNDDDYYKFHLDKAGKVRVQFRHPILHDTNVYWKVYIYNEQNECLLKFDVRGTDANINSAELGLASGTYYLLVEAYNYSDATYSFRINYSATNQWEKEVNDGYGTANDIKLNAAYSGANQFSNDKDYYKFKVNKAGKISINFRHSVLNDSNSYWNLYVYDEQTNRLLKKEIRGTESNVTTAELGLPAGTYYLLVEAYYHYSDATYTFKINYTASNRWETEVNDGYATADPITLGYNYNGAIQEGSDEDYYKFTMNSAGHVKVNFKHPNLNDNDYCWKVKLYNASTQVLASLDVRGMDTNLSTGTISLGRGTYYVCVTSGDYYYATSTYTLRVDNSYITSRPNLKISVPSYNKIKLSWNRFSSANGYAIYRGTSRGGTYKEIKSITGNASVNYTDSKITPGKTYYYKIRPYKKISGKKKYGSFSSIVKAKAAPGKVKLTFATAGKRNATITWRGQKNISGYEVYMSARKNGGYKKIKTISKASVVRFKKAGLTKGKRYYFKVRSYKVVNRRKVYSDFSNVKSVKIIK